MKISMVVFFKKIVQAEMKP